ncbi:hypothetical protein [Pseudomonas sp. LB3P38]|uniref:hypothetical protein n=1 Tax=Pseudomonas lyxosi TaxID=3398358 RepID=UPI0039EFA913
MKTYFVRHSSELDVDKETLQSLWDNDYIGIHYPHDNSRQDRDSFSVEPKDYPGNARHTLARLQKIGKEGGFIFGCYRGFPGGKIGYIEPDTAIEIFNGKWGDKNRQAGRDARLKVLKVHNVRNLSGFEGLSLTSVQPRQGTLCEWKKVGSRVKSLVSGKVSRDVGSLTPDLQEVMCMEFLRTDESLKLGLPRVLYTLASVGRTLKDLDILAIGYDGKPISAQVTYHDLTSAAATKKLNKLDPYISEGSHTILFCKCPSIQHINGHIVFSLDQVFKEFCLNSASGRLWFKMVSGAQQC